MNDAQHAVYSAYLRDLADRLLLRDWELLLQRDRAEDGSYACVWISDTENLATVRVCGDEFFASKAEDRREWLTHELLHAHLDRPDRVMTQLAAMFEDNTATQLAKTMHHKEVEVCVQRLARVLAPLMPLPPEVAE